MKRLLFALLLVSLLPVGLQAQIYVSPGSTFFIGSGTWVTTDSLALHPSVDLVLSGNYLRAVDTAIQGPQGPGIQRVGTFSDPVTYQGLFGLYYNAGLLNGNTESDLKFYYGALPADTDLKIATNSFADTNASFIGINKLTSFSLQYFTTADSGKVLPLNRVFFSNVTAGSMRIHFPYGNGTGRLVIMRAVSPVVNNPIDGTVYTADSHYGAGDAIGSGYAVYNGTGDTVTVSNLLPGTKYQVAVYEYNGVVPDYAAIPRTGDQTTKAGFATLRFQGQEHMQPLDSFINDLMPAGWQTSMDYEANDDGTISTPGIYSFGNAGSPDRAIGSIGSSASYSLCYLNRTGKTLTSLLLQYTGEQWRAGGSSSAGAEDSLIVEYSTNATAINNGTWIRAENLHFYSPQTGPAQPLDGNLPANQRTISGSISGITIPVNGKLWVRFTDVDLPGNDDALAIDNVITVPFENTYTNGAHIGSSSLKDLNVLSGTVTANTAVFVRYGLNVERGAILSFPSKPLTINGKVYGMGELSGNASSTLNVDGDAVNQNIRFAATGNILKRLNIAKGASATLVAPLRITPLGNVVVGSYSESDPATLSSNGNLILLSNAQGSASISRSEGVIIGSVVSERYLYADAGPANILNWRWLANPFKTSITPGGLSDDLPSISFTPGAGNVYEYVAATAPASSIANLNGNATQVINSAEEWETGTAMRFEKPAAATTVDAGGAVWMGDVNMTLIKGPSSDFVMAGNPYLSTIKIKTAHAQAVANGSIANVLYLWDPKSGPSGAFITVPAYKIGSRRIQPWQAFVVDMNASSATLHFTEGQKIITGNGGTAFRDRDSEDVDDQQEAPTPEGIIQLALYKKGKLQDELYQIFDEDALPVREDKDMLKLRNPSVNFYARSEDLIQLAGDARPFSSGKTIPLGVEAGMGGVYSFSVADYTLARGSDLYLVDQHTGIETLLGPGIAYTCSISKNDPADRFFLRMGGSAGIESVQGIHVDILPNPATDLVNIRVHTVEGGAAIVRILSASGALIRTETMESTTHGQLTIPVSHLAAGVYQVEVVTAEGSKIIKQLVKQ